MPTCCIVTPDLAPLEKNGGVGSACYHLAMEMVKSGVAVTILYFNWEGKRDMNRWTRWYAERGAEFVPLKRQAAYSLTDESPNYRASYDIMLYLKGRVFDFVHFMDYCGLGFHAIQAKRTAGLFGNTTLTVTVHAPHRWILEGMEQWDPDPLAGIKRDYMERYSCAHADILNAPSRYMIGWLKKNGWALPADTRVMPNCYAPRMEGAAYAPNVRKLIFFGRLEKRKGLDVFCEAVKRTALGGEGAVAEVAFLGKVGEVGGVRADEYIRRVLGGVVNYSVHADLNYLQAHEYIERARGLVIAPSYSDNHSYVLIECACKGYPFLCSDVGGNREIADAAACFDMNAEALAEAIRGACGVDFTAARHPYNPENAAALWAALHREARPSAAREAQQPLVSVCVPYYNHGAFIKRCVDALAADDYPNKEIIVVDDGSCDEASIQALNALGPVTLLDGAPDAAAEPPALSYPSGAPVLRLFRKANGGPGQTRNRAARLARGEYIVFADADNIPSPHMISAMTEGIRASGADCLTVYSGVFGEGERIAGTEDSKLVYAPLGGCAQCAAFSNTAGDTNAILRKSAFEAVGGFDEGLRQYEDWHLFVKLMLEGYDVDTIPEPLFLYRENAGGVNASANAYRGHRSIAELYKAKPAFCAGLMDVFYLPAFHTMGGGTGGGLMFALANRAWAIANRLIPPGSRRRRLVKRILRRNRA